MELSEFIALSILLSWCVLLTWGFAIQAMEVFEK